MITHSSAKTTLKRCRNKERGFKLINNTRLQKRGGAFAVRFHSTDIVTIRPDGTYRLNSGGWRTVTTKSRMNMALPCIISQTKGIWHIENTLYSDGMLIGPDGKVIGGEPVGDILKIKTEVDRRTSRFIKLLIQGCLECDLGSWESYEKKYALPCPASKIHLKKLWQTITEETNKQMDYPRTNYPTYLFVWVYLAILACKYDDEPFIWDLVRNSLIHQQYSIFVTSSLPRFMRPRKPLITQMIANKELTRS